MAAAALAIMQGSLGYNQSNFYSVPQAYQAVTQPGCAIKRLDLIPQVAQLTDGARKAIRAAHQPNIMPHDVLDSLHIPLD
jgi:hypothetical protein